MSTTHTFDINNANNTLSAVCAYGDTITLNVTANTWDIIDALINYEYKNSSTCISPKLNNKTLSFTIPYNDNRPDITDSATVKLNIMYKNISNNSYSHSIVTLTLTLVPQCILNSPGSLHLLDAQIIDDNKLFCVFESNNNNTIITHIQQSANRLAAYYKKLELETVPVIASMSGDILSVLDSSNYDIPDPDITVVILTPVKSSNVTPVKQHQFK